MSKFFQRRPKLHRPSRASAICSLKKFTSAYLFQIAREKSCDYLLITYMKKLLNSSAEEMHAYHAIREKLCHKIAPFKAHA